MCMYSMLGDDIIIQYGTAVLHAIIFYPPLFPEAWGHNYDLNPGSDKVPFLSRIQWLVG